MLSCNVLAVFHALPQACHSNFLPRLVYSAPLAVSKAVCRCGHVNTLPVSRCCLMLAAPLFRQIVGQRCSSVILSSRLIHTRQELPVLQQHLVKAFLGLHTPEVAFEAWNMWPESIQSDLPFWMLTFQLPRFFKHISRLLNSHGCDWSDKFH